ncbi:MAG: VOC family protein [Sinomicrobium sp.]|nr:VOC family protein [Sinomicrobium sp.]
MNNNVVGWFEIYVDDMQRAKTFYEFVFDRQLEKLGDTDIEMWAFNGDVNSYGAPGALVKIPGFPAGRNSVVVYFSCKDCAVQEKRVTEAGGRVEKTKFSVGPYGFISIVYDTENNLFGLHSFE